MEKILGVDISQYQKGINLSKAKNEGVKFAILRAGYTGYGNGVSKAKDTEFETHYKNAKNNGLGVGAYWFSCANTYAKGVSEANWMYENCLKGKQFEYPIYIDVEEDGGGRRYLSGSGKAAITEGIKGFCETLEKKGYYVGVYASSSWFKTYIDASIPSKYDCWVANWGTNNPSTPSHGLWQFGGETNMIRTNKIAGYVCDQNYAYKDYPSIMKNNGLNGFTKAKEENKVNTPVTPKKSVETVAKEVIEGKWSNGEERKAKLRTCGGSTVLVEEESTVLVRNKEARSDCVTTDACACKVSCKPLSKVGDTGLCCRVCRNLGKRNVSVHRGDVKDVTALALYHILCKGLGGKESTLEVELEYKVNAVRIKVEEGLAAFLSLVVILVVGGSLGAVTARTVYKDVAGTEITKNCLVNLLKSYGIKHVCLVTLADEALSLKLVSKLLYCILVKVKSSNLCACLSVSSCHIAAKNAACTGNNYYLTGKIYVKGKINHLSIPPKINCQVCQAYPKHRAYT